MSVTIGDIIAELQQIYTDDYELLAALKNIKELVEDAHNQAVSAGIKFQMIRIGEDHPKTTECRQELDEVYTPLAKTIDVLYEQVQ